MSDTALATTQSSLARRDELTIEDMVAQVQKVQQVMAKVMKEGEHYGVIPGTGSKPSLLKPGAEKLCLLFRLAPAYTAREAVDGKHLTIESTCALTHIPTGELWGAGMGSCSTKESKYAYRQGKRLCPKCDKDTIIKGKPEYGGGWLCFAKKGGCGEKWAAGAVEIEGQSLERVANEDLADQYNTVLKMANKRALVAAVLNVTAASDIFTQDLEDMPREARPAPQVVEAKEVSREPGTGPAGPRADSEAAPRGQDDAHPVGEPVISDNQGKRFYAIARGAKPAAWTDAQIKTLLADWSYEHVMDITLKDYDAIVERLKRGPTSKPGPQQEKLA